KAVELADQARAIYKEETILQGGTGHKNGYEDIRIVLSLGPFGASLIPTQEWDAFYPPPYGPAPYNSSGDVVNRNSFTVDEEEASVDSVRALAEFHRERLMMFLEDEEGRKVWNKVDCIAFETIPLVREIRAIRIAVSQAFQGRDELSKPWWISAIFPDGIFPEGNPAEAKLRLEKRDVVRAMLGSMTNPENGLPVLTPCGIGVNCTLQNHIARILEEFEIEVKLGKELYGICQKLWLVVYPNAGDVFDLASQEWVEEEEPMKSEKADLWAQNLTEIVKKTAETKTWETIVVVSDPVQNQFKFKHLGENQLSVK
ncbi:AdoMet-homocysteine methyltransferase, partial [Marasmius crinis-equi]